MLEHLVKFLGGFTEGEFDALRFELEDQKTARLIDRAILEERIRGLEKEIIDRKEITNDSTTYVAPIQIQSVPWTRRKRELEKEDFLRSQRENKFTTPAKYNEGYGS
jgi:hypothetical protein